MAQPPTAASPQKASGIPRKVWAILGLLLAMGVLNYFDRQTLSILKSTLKASLSFDDESYSLLTFAFMLPYIVMYVGSGRLIDRFGTRICMTIFGIGWSVANIASGLSHSFAHLFAARALLGASEPGAFPVIQRAIVTWVPIERRAFAFSLVSPVGSIGAVLAPPLIALLATLLDWRAAFVIPGTIGLVIALIWWLVDKTDQSATEPQAAPERHAPPVGLLFRNKHYWAIIAARMLSDPVWYFYLFWIPGYLQDKVGLSLGQLGMLGGIPYVVAIIACLVMGRGIDRLVARGHDSVRIQLRFFLATAALMPLGALSTMTTNPLLAIAIISVIVSVCQSWFVGTNVLLAGLFPREINASALGILGAVGASTALLFNLCVGTIIEHFGYTVIFVFMAILHPISAIILNLVIGSKRAEKIRDTVTY